MPGPKETGPTKGPASDLSVGFHSNHSQNKHQPDQVPTLDQLEDLASFAAGQRFPNELVQVVRERSAARNRAIQRVRQDARDAVKRTLPNSLTDPEILLQRETATLYAKLVKLEKTGKLRWDQRTRNWVKRRPVITRTDQSRPPSYTENEILERFDKVRRNGKRFTAQCPVHDDKTPSLAITEGERAWLLKCWAGCDFTEIIAAVDLEPSRMFYR